MKKQLDNQLAIFEGQHIRQVWHKEEWYYAVADIIQVLTESKDAKAYWRKLKQREPQLVTICHSLKMRALDGKNRKTDCANREGLFRIIQSVPSPKAEPFKQWLAKVGQERLQEIENPELALERAAQYYRDLGYEEEWIQHRLRSKTVRKKLAEEWKKRGVKEGKEYAILTAEISKGTFGIKPATHKKIKGLKKEGLRDHMTDLELIFTALGETQTRIEAEKRDAQGFEKNKIAAKVGGQAAGKTRTFFEKETKQKVVSSRNYLQQIKSAVKKQLSGKSEGE